MDQKNIKAEVDSLKPLLQPVAHLKLLTHEEERDLIRKAQAGDERARTKLVRHNLRMVVKEAKRFMGRGIPLEDLVQEGSGGLCRAIQLFDLDRLTPKGTPYKFSTYAVWWIKQPMQRSIDNKSRVVKVPQGEISLLTAVKKAYMELIEQRVDKDGVYGVKPTPEDIVEAFNKNPQYLERNKGKPLTVKKAMELGRIGDPIYLDEAVGEDEDLSLVDYLIDDSYTPDESSEVSADKEYIKSLLSKLTKSDSDFVKLRFGFVDNQEKTDRQMAILLKITIKEAKERWESILHKLQEFGSEESINSEVFCSLEITAIEEGSYYKVFNVLQKLTRLDHTQLRCLMRVFPCVVFHKMTQHLAREAQSQLEEAGATVMIERIN